MSEDEEDWRLKQDGIVVARVIGRASFARQDIGHYARMYGRDGPVIIEKKIGRRFRESPL